MKKTGKNMIIKTSIAGLCLALCWLLPFLTGQIPEIGNMLCPMHLPVFLCGFICGPWYGLILGFIAPLTRSLIFSMPPFFPKAFAMAFELAAYGVLSGVLYKILPKKNIFIYVSLLISMVGGRVVWGIVNFALMMAGKTQFSLSIFVSSGFAQAVPGIILQIVLIPVLIMALKKANLMQKLN